VDNQDILHLAKLKADSERMTAEYEAACEQDGAH
jgi:hypothetical protein